MKRREAQQRIEQGLTRLALLHVDRSAEMLDGMRDAGEASGVQAMRKMWRLVQRYTTRSEGVTDEVTAELAEVLEARGAGRGRAEDEAASLVGLVQALVTEFPDAAQLGRAARLVAVTVTGGPQEHPQRARAALDAWRDLETARAEALPAGDTMEALMAQGAAAVERSRRRRRHELGVHDLEARFVGAWIRCLGP